MLSANQKEVLSMIFGDDLEAIGDIVIVRDQEEGMFLVNNRGEKLLPGSCYGVGRFLGPKDLTMWCLQKRKHTRTRATTVPKQLTRSTFTTITLTGWLFLIPRHKATGFTRRWASISSVNSLMCVSMRMAFSRSMVCHTNLIGVGKAE